MTTEEESEPLRTMGVRDPDLRLGGTQPYARTLHWVYVLDETALLPAGVL